MNKFLVKFHGIFNSRFPNQEPSNISAELEIVANTRNAAVKKAAKQIGIVLYSCEGWYRFTDCDLIP